MDQIHFDMEEKMLTLEQEAKIKEKALKIKEEKNCARFTRWLYMGRPNAGKRNITSLYGGTHLPAVLQIHGCLKEG